MISWYSGPEKLKETGPTLRLILIYAETICNI